MNQPEDSRARGKPRDGGRADGSSGCRTRCEEIQPLLLDFLTRELGGARADVIREHLRRCSACRAAASEMQTTVEALRRVPGAGEGDQKLSEKHRARILKSITHPILAWMDRHHVLVSIIVVIVAALAVFALLRRVRLLKEDHASHITVTIGVGGETDEQPKLDPVSGRDSETGGVP